MDNALVTVTKLLARVALESRGWRSQSVEKNVLDNLRNTLLIYYTLQWTRHGFWKIRGKGAIGVVVDFYAEIRYIAYGYWLRAPGICSQVEKQVGEALAKLSAIPTGKSRYLTLPEGGLDEDVLLLKLDGFVEIDHARWEDGYVSGAVYYGEDGLIHLQADAFGKFTVPLRIQYT